MSFQEQIQFALNKKLEHCTTTNVYVLNQRAIQAVWVVHTHFSSVQLYISSGSKRKSEFVRINTDVLALVTKSECADPEDIHLQHPFMASL